MLLKKKLQKEFDSLQHQDVVLHYRDLQFTYVLQFCDKKYKWYKRSGSVTEFNVMTFQKLREFDTLKDFWLQFISDTDWFKVYLPHDFHTVLIGCMISTHNELVNERDLSAVEYKSLYKWVKLCYYKLEDSIKYFAQTCGNCRRLIQFSPRYPKAICSQCYGLEMTDEYNTPLVFYNDSHNTFKILYYNPEHTIIKEELKQTKKHCYIQGKLFVAEPHHFGGIVIQKEEELKFK